MKRFILSIFLLFCFFILSVKISLAADYRTDYNVEYFLEQNREILDTRVQFQITITNLRADKYVKKFVLSFPKSFEIRNLQAADDNGSITPAMSLSSSGEFNQIELEFSDPKTGEGTKNNITLSFLQNNLFKVDGNIWEVILPTIAGREEGNYNVILNLPPARRKISVAKPKPDLISGNKIYWNNPTTKTIYAVFGDKQYYEMKLRYNLENSNLFPVYTDIALPPDTLYQKTYIKSLVPRPSMTYIDDDGNLMARYFLKPKEKEIVIYDGAIEISQTHREDNIEFVRNQYKRQRNFLFSQQNEWTLTNLNQIEKLKSPRDIYDFTVSNLKYDYSRVTKNVRRMGAQRALANPTTAVCTEFSDVFIAIAREKGIAAREIEGYGFSSDSQLRPLSLVSDILHSWPEYYDEQARLWKPVDPTWENTSGIDYFSSFDLNHIVFVIHGKKSDYPLAAGMYKITDTKDILVKTISQIPEQNLKFTINGIKIPDKINDHDDYKAELIVRNEGNVYAWDVPIDLQSTGLTISSSPSTITAIPPYSEEKIMVELRALPNKSSGQINLILSEGSSFSKTIKIVPYYVDILFKIFYVILGISSLYLIIFLIRRKNEKIQKII